MKEPKNLPTTVTAMNATMAMPLSSVAAVVALDERIAADAVYLSWPLL